MSAGGIPPVIHLVTENFTASLWFCHNPPHHRVYIGVPTVPGGKELSDEGLECSREQLQELMTTAKTLIAMMEHLENGGTIVQCGVDPTNN